MLTAALLVCSAALFCCAFPNFLFIKGVPLCAWGCALPLLCVIDGKKARERFCLGLGWGLMAHGMLVAWLFPVSPWGWAVFATALAVQGVLFAMLFPAREVPLTVKLFLIPSAWVASEWVRTFVLGGFAWSLGYSQASVPEVLQPAALGGVYAVAWVIVLVNTAFYLLWRTHGNKSRFWLWGVAIIVIVVLGSSLRMLYAVRAAATVRVAAIQPNILRDDKTREDLYDDNVMRHMNLTKKAVTAGWLGPRDLVIWPETAFTDDVLTDVTWRPRLEMAARSMAVNILVGSALLWDGHDLNSAVLLSSGGDWKSVYHKVRLVPFGEFTPRGAGMLAAALHMGRYHFTPGSRTGSMAIPGGSGFGVVICSEELYPEMFIRLAATEAVFAAVMLNDGWFARPEALYLHALAAPLRAVESGLSVVRAANTGRTCAFDAYGRPLGRSLNVQRPDVAVYDVPGSAVHTFYARYGDVFALMCLVFVIMMRLSIQLKRSGVGPFHGVP